MGNRNRMSRGLFMWAQSGLLLETGMYFNAPNHPHTPHINQGQHAGSSHDCQPQETRMHFMWTFVGKCSIIYLTGAVVVVVVVCVCLHCVCVCVYSKLSQNALGQTVLWASKRKKDQYLWKCIIACSLLFKNCFSQLRPRLVFYWTEGQEWEKEVSLQYPLPVILLDAFYVYFLTVGTTLQWSLFIPFFGWENWGLQRLSNFLKVTKMLNGGVGFWTR